MINSGILRDKYQQVIDQTYSLEKQLKKLKKENELLKKQNSILYKDQARIQTKHLEALSQAASVYKAGLAS